MKALQSFEISGASSPPTQPHFAEDMNPQGFYCWYIGIAYTVGNFQCHAVFSGVVCSSC